MDQLLIFTLIALLAVLLAAALGYMVGKVRASAGVTDLRAAERAASLQIEALRRDSAAMQDVVASRLAEERSAGDTRVLEARAVGDRAVAAAKAEGEQHAQSERIRLAENAAKSETALIVAHQGVVESAAREREKREVELAERIAEVERDGAAAVEQERARSSALLDELRAAHQATLVRLADERAERDVELTERAVSAKISADLELAAERRRGQTQIEEMRADHKRLADEFEALSARALEANSAAFLAQAEERLKRSQTEGAAELQRREDAVKQLIDPIAETLTSVQGEVVTAERARAEASATLTVQLKNMLESSAMLNAETRKLVNALRSPQVRGRWGELQLRRVVEAAGMINHVDFEEQSQHETDEGRLRPDLVVHLAGDKRVVVDSKVAFSGYLEAMEATDEAVRTQKLTSHARHLRKHIDDLGGKEYWDAVNGSPEFVVMFVPAEPFLTAALDQDSSLFEHAFARNVIIATPSTLVALLRTVGHAWRQDQLANEAQQIFAVGKELHKRLGTAGDHLSRLGKSLNSTVENYNKFARSLDTQVVTQARRFSALQGLEPVIDGAKPVEALATPPQKSDLYSESTERPDDTPALELVVP